MRQAHWRHGHNSMAIASGLMALPMAAFVHERSCAGGLEFAAGPRQTRGKPLVSVSSSAPGRGNGRTIQSLSAQVANGPDMRKLPAMQGRGR